MGNEIGEGFENKLEAYEKIVGGKPDAIFILSGGIVQTDKGRSKSTAYPEHDYLGFTGGGKARVVAAAELAQFFPDSKIIANSYVTTPDDKVEPHARVYKEELLRLGVQEDRILIQENSFNTITEIIEMVKLAA